MSQARLGEMIEAATVDAYSTSEQATGWAMKIEEQLALPFKTRVLGAEVKVTKIEVSPDDAVVAVCLRGRQRQVIPVLDLPLPVPPPAGAEWIRAYRCWLRGRS